MTALDLPRPLPPHDALARPAAVTIHGVATAYPPYVLGLSPNVQRLPVFGLGCAGGVIGLSRAAALARATPGQWVLFMCTELCSLTFRAGDDSKSNVIATTIFGDGAAAMLLRAGNFDDEGAHTGRRATIRAW